MIHYDSKLNFTLVHAGIPAEWSFSQTLTFAYEVESALAQGNYLALLENRTQDQSRWHAKLRDWKRLRFITNALILLKYCNDNGKLEFNVRGAINTVAEGLVPWYRLPDRLTANLNIIFSDDAGFDGNIYPGIYPLPSQGGLCAWKLSTQPERIRIDF